MGLLWLKRIDPLSELVPRWMLERGRGASGTGEVGPERLVVLRPGGLGDFVILTHAAARVGLRREDVVWIGERRNAIWPALLGLDCRCYDVPAFNLKVIRGGLRAKRMICTEQTFGLAAVWGRLACARDAQYLGFDSNRRADLYERQISYTDEYELEPFTRLLTEASGGTATGALEPETLCRYYGLELGELREQGGRTANEHGVEVAPFAVVALAGLQLDGKRLSAGQWRAVVRRVVGAHGSVLLMGAPADRDAAAEIASGLPARAVRNLVGQLSFPEVVRIIAAAAKVYSVDSGLVHVADFVGVPSEVMFPTGSSVKWGPRTAGSRVIEAGELPQYLGEAREGA